MELFFRQMGQGQPLIILHGLFGASDNWMTLGRRFAENHEVFLVDQRHHGRSPNLGAFNYPTLAEDLAHFIDKQGIENPIILGHSMGGKVAMQYAVQNPNALKKLVVVDIAPRQYPVHHGQILEGLNSLDLSTLKSRGQADKALKPYIPQAGVRAFLLKNLYRDENKNFAWRINLPTITENIEIIGHALDWSAPVASLPSLFVQGVNSDYITQGDWPQIREIFPQAELLQVQQAGHWVHAEQPEFFFDQVNTFLAA